MILTVGCQKANVSVTPLSSLNMVNAMVGVPAVKANWTNSSSKSSSQFYSQISATVGYGASYTYGVLANKSIPLTVVSTADTVNALFSGNFNLPTGGVFTFFLAGYPGAIDTVLIKEAIPVYNDSSCGVRFINLVYNGNPISIRQASSPGIADFSAIGYKQYTDFKQYTADVAHGSYGFQIVDDISNVVLASYTLSAPLFHNVTLTWVGQAGGTGGGAPKIFRINNY